MQEGGDSEEIAGPHHSDSGVATEKNKSHQEQQQSKPKHSPFQNKTKQNKKKSQTFLTNQTIDQANGELFFFKKKEEVPSAVFLLNIKRETKTMDGPPPT
jgi:hypothetical protein